MNTGHEPPASAGDQADWEALARFLAGESPAAEAEAVRGWLAEDPARQATLSALDRAIARAVPPPPAVDVEAALAHAHARMDAPAERPAIPFRPRERRPGSGWRAPAYLRMAALVLVLVGGAFLGMRMLRGPAARTVVLSASTEVGERDSLRLPDGTRVLLGPGSRVTYTSEYGRRERQVRLEGEAMFQVVHDGAPFTVLAGAARVRDIGTAFSVQTGPGGGVRVVVTDGAVALRSDEASDDAELVLHEGERGVLASARARPQRTAASDDDIAWTRGELVFHDAPLAQVAADVRRWYGVDLRADGAVAGRRLTAEFAGEPREQVLRVMALALGAELSVRGDTAVLSAASAESPR